MRFGRVSFAKNILLCLVIENKLDCRYVVGKGGRYVVGNMVGNVVGNMVSNVVSMWSVRKVIWAVSGW